MRLLLVNPNTSGAITATIAESARAVAGRGTEIMPVKAPFGARVIGTRTEAAVADHACLDALAQHAPGTDAAIMASGYGNPAKLPPRPPPPWRTGRSSLRPR